jgi:hypothetical protein
MFWAWGEGLGQIRNLSSGGAMAFVEGLRAPEQGTKVDLSFALPGLVQQIHRSAVVRWAVRDQGVLLGLEFDRALDQEAIEALQVASRLEAV